MLALGTLLLSSVWQATTAAGHVIPRDLNDTMLSGNDTGNYTGPVRGDYIWTPTCKLPSPSDLQFNMGFNYSDTCIPGTGTLRAYMIFVDFPDAVAGNESAQAMYDSLAPPASEWYAQASYGTLNLNVSADTTAYHRMPKEAAAYNWQGSGWSARDYIQDALDAFTANGARPPPPEVDVLYVVPTAGAQHWFSRSWTEFNPVPTRQGEKVATKTIIFAADPLNDLNYKTMVHETGHTFCLPDYYSFSNYAGFYVGSYSIMGTSSKSQSPDYFAWDKYRLGWFGDEAVDCLLDAGSSEHVLTPLAVKGPGKKAVIVAASEISALIAEVRVAEGVDAETCAPGVLLTVVNTRTGGGNGPIRVLDATPGSNGCVGFFDVMADATLALSLEGSKSLAWSPVSSFDVPDFGVKVTLVSVEDQKYTIRVDRQHAAKTDSW